MCNKHVMNCMHDGGGKKGDAIHQAIFIPHGLVSKQNEVGVYSRHSANTELMKIPFYGEHDCTEIRRGWARRANWGEAMGPISVEKFKLKIKKWFDIRVRRARKEEICEGVETIGIDSPWSL